MYKVVFKLFGTSSVVLAATFLLAGSSAVKAQTTPELSEENTNNRIERTDPSYQTLQRLATKYECLPEDSAILTSKRKTITRQAFTSNLSTCLQSMEELIARRRRKPIRRRVTPAPVAPPVDTTPVDTTPPAVPPEAISPPAPQMPTEPVPPTVSTEPEVTQQDLDAIKGLVATFDSDLAALEKRVTSKSFSTTTKLVGEGIINFGGYGGVPSNPTRLGSNNFFTNRLRLNFDTSFSGKDRLRSRLQARDTSTLTTATGTPMTRLGFDGNDVTDNNNVLSLFQYDFPIGDNTKIRVATTGYEFNDNQPTLNPQLSSSANGSISRFGRFNPIFRLSGDGAAVTVAQKLGDQFSLDVGYAVPVSNATANVTPNNGFFQGQNSILSQLTYAPSKDFSIAALYGHTYNNAGNLFGSTGSAAANNPFSTTAINGNLGTNVNANGTLAATTNQNTSANHYSILATYKLSDNAIISGWAGFVQATQTAGGGTASLSNYAITLAFPDFGAEGNMLGFVFGIPPKLNSRSFTTATGVVNTTTGNPDTSYHLEALYKVRLNENMDITPGLLLITSPEHNSANPTEYVGTVRTTFRF